MGIDFLSTFNVYGLLRTTVTQSLRKKMVTSSVNANGKTNTTSMCTHTHLVAPCHCVSLATKAERHGQSEACASTLTYHRTLASFLEDEATMQLTESPNSNNETILTITSVIHTDNHYNNTTNDTNGSNNII